MSRQYHKAKWQICIVIIAAIVVIVASCSKQSEDILKSQRGGGTCDTVGMRFSVNVLPILQANCYRCHAGGIINGGVSLDGYSNVVLQVQNGNLIAAITHAAGVVPMPFDGGKLSDCNIAIIQAWINEGAPDN